ncbi:MAG: type II toxin-antitoxin system toxin DNA ADP-ribosyl transferase DarT [Halothiobacillaceae bacterium]
MSQPPANPKIYHITHVANLANIIANGGLSSDAAILQRGGPAQIIGMSDIKRRRLEDLEVSCHPGTKVGEYVPFYFCPRSIMLYVIHRANHPELTYLGGQDPIVHLQADLHQVVKWAEGNNVRWAFSLSNAGARYTEFRSSLESMDELDWTAIDARDFRDPDVKERKQAEFLVYGSFPLGLIERIGVRTAATQVHASRVLSGAGILMPVEVCPEWYF